MNDHIKWLIQVLDSWKETFDNESDEETEGDEEAYKKVSSLIQKIKKGELNQKDWDTIIFHLWQKFGGE